MSDVSRKTTLGSRAIVDLPTFGSYLKAIIWLALGCFFFYLAVTVITGVKETSGMIVVGCIFIGFGLLVIKGCLAKLKGYVIDTDNDIFEYPEGFGRHHVTLSEIRQINGYQEVTPGRSIKNDNGREMWRTSDKKEHLLEISGDFGNVEFTFSEKGTRDKVYWAIVKANNMG